MSRRTFSILKIIKSHGFTRINTDKETHSSIWENPYKSVANRVYSVTLRTPT